MNGRTSHFGFVRLSDTTNDVVDERYRQERLVAEGKIPWDCADPNVRDDAKLAVLGEEFGEVARAILEGEGLRDELIQVAAVAVAWAESLIERLANPSDVPDPDAQAPPAPPNKAAGA